MTNPLFHRKSVRFFGVLRLLYVGTVVSIAVILILPRNAGLWNLYPVVQLDALPGAWIATLTVCAILTGIRLLRTPAAAGSRRSVWRLIFTLFLVIVVVEVTIFIRSGGMFPAGFATVTGDQGDITVLSFNARGTSASEIIGAILETEADAVLLVETNGVVAAGIIEQLKRENLEYQLFLGDGTAPGSQQQVAIIVTDRLGTYYQVPGPALAFGGLTIVAEGPGGAIQGAPTLSAVHPLAPLPGVVSSTAWRMQLERAVVVCSRESAIVGGDFNASSAHISHLMSPQCLDAGAHLGRGSVGTWPAFVPAPLGASIDHQLANRNQWEPVGVRFLNVGESDHRGVAVAYQATNP